jgi:hypothetical protein
MGAGECVYASALGTGNSMYPKAILSICILAFTLAGCLQGEGPGDDWTLDSGRPDAERDAGQDVSPPSEPVETTIWLKNDTDRTLYVQTVEGCRVSPPAWIDWTASGRPVDRCAICNCDRLDGDPRCRACPEACPLPTVQSVEPGTRVEWAWSGYRWVDDRASDRDCERREIPSIGDPIRVHVCWSDSLQGTSGQGRSVHDPTCREVTFDYGTSRAGHTVEAEENGPPIFKLTNSTDRAVRVMTTSDCRTNPREWISVIDGQNRLELTSSCAQCQCESVGGDTGCLVCLRVCQPANWRMLRSDETTTHQWDGVGWAPSQKSGTQCVERTSVSVGDPLAARFCWTEQTDGAVDPDAMTCTDVDFTYGSDRIVRYSIE